jgi:hypothetical protein
MTVAVRDRSALEAVGATKKIAVRIRRDDG